MENTNEFYHENATTASTAGEAAMVSKWLVDVYVSSEVIVAAAFPALWLFATGLLSPCGQERLGLSDVVEVSALHCAVSCYVEEQGKVVPVFLHKCSSPRLCWFLDLRII